MTSIPLLDYYLCMRNLHHSVVASISAYALFGSMGLLSTGAQAANQLPGKEPTATHASAPAPFLTPRAQAESVYEVLLAEVLANEGSFAEGYELLMRAGQTRNDPQLFARATQLAFAGKDGNRALRAAQAWQQAEPQSRDANKAVFQVLLLLNQIPQTQWYLEQELALTPEDEMQDSLAAIALIYRQVPNKQQVVEVVSAALSGQLQESSPWYADALGALGRVSLVAGHSDKAVEMLAKGYQHNPNSSGNALLALELIGAGNQPARIVAQAYANSKQPSADFLMSYSRLLLSQDKNAQALAMIEKMTQLYPSIPEAWLAQAALQASAKQYEKALKSADQLAQILNGMPENQATVSALDEVNSLRAQVHQYLGQNDQAAHWADSIESPEQYFSTQIQRANIVADHGDQAAAFKIIDALPEDEPEAAHVKLNAKVQLLSHTGQAAQAFELHKQLLKTVPNNDDVIYEHALLADRAGNNAEMEKILRQLIARAPEHYQAKNALGYSLADRNSNLPEARRLITEALSHEPDNAFIQDSLGWLEFRAGHLAKAQEILLNAFNNTPDAEIAAHLGEVLWAQGLRAEAREIWAKGLYINDKNEALKATIQRLDPQNANP